MNNCIINVFIICIICILCLVCIILINKSKKNNDFSIITTSVTSSNSTRYKPTTSISYSTKQSETTYVRTTRPYFIMDMLPKYFTSDICNRTELIINTDEVYIWNINCTKINSVFEPLIL